MFEDIDIAVAISDLLSEPAARAAEAAGAAVADGIASGVEPGTGRLDLSAEIRPLRAHQRTGRSSFTSAKERRRRRRGRQQAAAEERRALAAPGIRPGLRADILAGRVRAGTAAWWKTGRPAGGTLVRAEPYRARITVVEPRASGRWNTYAPGHPLFDALSRLLRLDASLRLRDRLGLPPLGRLVEPTDVMAAIDRIATEATAAPLGAPAEPPTVDELVAEAPPEVAQAVRGSLLEHAHGDWLDALASALGGERA